MKLLSLTCNQCGAPLEVPEKTKFVTCQFCESRLAVHRTDAAAYTEVLEALEQKTDHIANEVERLKLQNTLMEIDRDWERQKESFMVKGKDGHMSIPSKAGSAFGGVIGVAIGLVWMAVAANAGGIFVLFGLIIIVMVMFGAASAFQKADGYERSRRRYKERRLDILSKMKE